MHPGVQKRTVVKSVFPVSETPNTTILIWVSLLATHSAARSCCSAGCTDLEPGCRTRSGGGNWWAAAAHSCFAGRSHSAARSCSAAHRCSAGSNCSDRN